MLRVLPPGIATRLALLLWPLPHQPGHEYGQCKKEFVFANWRAACKPGSGEVDLEQKRKESVEAGGLTNDKPTA
jgi:hypothetical protein